MTLVVRIEYADVLYAYMHELIFLKKIKVIKQIKMHITDGFVGVWCI